MYLIKIHSTVEALELSATYATNMSPSLTQTSLGSAQVPSALSAIVLLIAEDRSHH